MHQNKINEFIKDIVPDLKKRGLIIIDEQPIQYAKKIKIQKEDETGVIVVYWSKKKGYSFIAEGNFNFKSLALSVLNREQFIPQKQEIEIGHVYTGMDESGKGDYFGPLVLCGFSVNREISEELENAGVRDCKKLSDTKVKEIYYILKSDFKNYFKYKVLLPEHYNEKINDFNSCGMKLNHLLGNLYSELILNFDDISKTYLIDRFGDEKYVLEFLPSNNYKLILKEKAESYTGVAAASIVARAVFLEHMEFLSNKCGLELPLGANSKVDNTARQLYKKLGENGLKKYVKWHFKNTKKIKEVK